MVREQERVEVAMRQEGTYLLCVAQASGGGGSGGWPSLELPAASCQRRLPAARCRTGGVASDDTGYSVEQWPMILLDIGETAQVPTRHSMRKRN